MVELFRSPAFAAFVRAVGGGIVVAAVVFFNGWNPDDVNSTNNAVAEAGRYFFVYLGVRFGIEGIGDQARAFAGRISPADVGIAAARMGKIAPSQLVAAARPDPRIGVDQSHRGGYRS